MPMVPLLVGENWRQYLVGDEYGDINLFPSEWWVNSDGTVYIYAYSDIEVKPYVLGFTLEVPQEEMNERYFTAQ